MKFLYQRYAIYILPAGKLGQLGAQWLGWDIHNGTGVDRTHPALPEVPLCVTPQKYGFHATLKAPFRLAQGENQTTLLAAFHTFCAQTPAARLGPLSVQRLGSFFALTPKVQDKSLSALEAATVRSFSPFRAPLTDADLERRRAKGLRPDQEERLRQWGYPHVFEHFRAHFTLTGNVPKPQRPDIQAMAEAWFGAQLDQDHIVDALALVGERADGFFEQIDTVPLQSPNSPLIS